MPDSKARLANLECAILDTPVSLARRTTGISVAVIHSRKCVPERDPLAPVNSEPMRLTDQALGLQLDTSIKKKNTPLLALVEACVSRRAGCRSQRPMVSQGQ